MSKERLEAFFDAVLAIIITILVLDLDQPPTADLAGLWALREAYFAYTLSFFWVGTIWINMYRRWQHIEKVSGGVLWAAVVMLFFTSLIPYVTNYAGENFYNAFAQCFYGAVAFLVTLSSLFLNLEMSKANYENTGLTREYRTLNRWIFYDLICKLVGILLALFIWPPLAMVSILLAEFFLTMAISRRVKSGIKAKK